jgi:hypothetical protein
MRKVENEVIYLVEKEVGPRAGLHPLSVWATRKCLLSLEEMATAALSATVTALISAEG